MTGASRVARFEPSNFGVLDASDEAVARDARYALQIAAAYVDTLPGGLDSLAGARVLEIGPGHHLGSLLVLAALGARPAAADRFLVSWDEVYHPRVYGELRTLLRREHPDWSVVPIDAVLDAGAHEAVIELHPSAAESMVGVPDGSFDIVLSNAVLEHVVNLDAACAEMARVTRTGGWGVHQVDHRDHRDFSRPLDYLLLDDERFATLFHEMNGECGNRLRRFEVEASFRDAGFYLEEARVTEVASPAVLARTLRSLRNFDRSSYRGCSADELEVLGCCYVVRRER